MKLVTLTDTFYDMYANCPEILQKDDRPYLCLTLKIDNVKYAIPFRHHISHNYCFRTVGDAGIDFTKAVIISDDAHILEGARVSSEEWALVRNNEEAIIIEFKKYLTAYKKALKHPDVKRNYSLVTYSALQYFIK